MLGTYAAVLAVCGASLAYGQAAIALCGVRRWSWLAPPVGLALLLAVCWGTVRLPGDGVVPAILVPLLLIAAVGFLRGRVEGGGEALRAGWPVALGALVAASLPFIAEGHFGILGTSFNPDMSQHLLAADRLADGHGSQLLTQGYPLGPHSLVVALDKGLGIGLVQGFSGLTVAVAVLAPLTALAAFAQLRALPRTAAALVVGLAYVVASYFAQGAFKETMEALLLLGFVLALREAGRGWAGLPLRFVPAALIAVGAVYAYSFPGLIWLGGAFVFWLLAEAALGRRQPPWRPLLLAALPFVVLIAPEIGRMIDFQQFETFDPNGPGLGNLFGQVSPFEALGIWPSGDFRLAPGDGAVPAIGYYLGAAFALVLLVHGIWRCAKDREVAILSGLAAAALAYAAGRLGGTAYASAKAIEVAAPICALVILLPLLAKRSSSQAAGGGAVGGPTAEEALATAGRGGTAVTGPAAAWLAYAFIAVAGVCSLLALANAPVGPTSYTSALNDFRKQVGAGPSLVLADPELLEDEHGMPFLSWELRGGRVCIRSRDEPGGLPPGTRFVITEKGGTYQLREVPDPPPGKSPCPLIAVRQARQGPAR
ncbi:MAG: hypothetical protein QOE75_317 [Solirubrobacterales bacterium]|jgi:hypothetical protein|nr:hypothetical protein [Solirubrobacterales bacterium]